MELGSEIPLMSSPEGLYKLIEIGVNNYDPHLFLHQSFTIYFFKREFGLQSETSSELAKPDLPQAKMQLDDSEILRQRIASEVVAMGEFTAEDLVSHATHSSDFTDVEPR